MNVLNAAIYSRLQTTTAITSLLSGTTAIYNQQAPEGATLPFIVFSTPSELDENMTQNRTKNNVVYIRAYSGSSAAQAGSIAFSVGRHTGPATFRKPVARRSMLHGGSMRHDHRGGVCRIRRVPHPVMAAALPPLPVFRGRVGEGAYGNDKARMTKTGIKR